MRARKHFLFFLLVATALSAGGATPEARDLALARSIRGVYRTLPEDSPARYAADQIASRFWYSLELGRLEGTIPATARQLEEARTRLSPLLHMQRDISWLLLSIFPLSQPCPAALRECCT